MGPADMWPSRLRLPAPVPDRQWRREPVFHRCDMTPEMRDDVANTVKLVEAAFMQKRDIVRNIGDLLNQAYGRAWHVLLFNDGEPIRGSFMPEKYHFADLSYGWNRYQIWKFSS